MNLSIFLWPWPTPLQGAEGKGCCVSSLGNTGRKRLSHGEASAKACTLLDSELRERHLEETGLGTFWLTNQIVYKTRGIMEIWIMLMKGLPPAHANQAQIQDPSPEALTFPWSEWCLEPHPLWYSQIWSLLWFLHCSQHHRIDHM